MDMAPMYWTIHGIITEVVNIFDPLMAQCLDIWYYDYQDTGQYICSWTSKGVNVSTSTDLIVYGRIKYLIPHIFKYLADH